MMQFFLHRKISGSLFYALVIAVLISAIYARYLYRDALSFSLQVSMSSSVSDHAHLYYDTGNGLSERESTGSTVQGDNQFHSYNLSLPLMTIKNLRFDPLTTSGTVSIKRISVVNGFGTSLSSIDLHTLRPTNQIKAFDFRDNTLTVTIEENANDPQIFIPLHSPLKLDTFQYFFILPFAGLLFGGFLIVFLSTLFLIRILKRSILTVEIRQYLLGPFSNVIKELTISPGGPPIIDRTDWIDALKGIAISLIVLGHIVWARPLSNYFYAISIPLFFILSGYLFNLNKYVDKPFEFIKNRFLSLIVPFISVTIMAVIVAYLLNTYNRPLYSLLYIFLIQTIVTGAMAMPTIWFLPSLFACVIVFYFLSKYTYKKHIYLFIIGIVIIAYLSMIYNKNPWFAHSVYGLFAIGFYGIGFILREKFEDVFFKNGLELSFIFAILFYIFAGIDWVTMPGVSGMNALYYYIIALLGIFPIIYAIKKLYENKIKLRILEYYGKNSLIVYLVHVPLINLIYNYIVPVNVINVWVIAGVIFVSCLPFIYLINKYFPFIIGKRRIQLGRHSHFRQQHRQQDLERTTIIADKRNR